MPVNTLPRFCAGIGHLFTEWDLLDRFALARDHGFEGVELTLPYEFSAAQLEQARSAAGVEVVLFTAPLGDFMEGGEGNAAVPGKEAEFTDSVTTALEYASTLGAQYVQFVAGRCIGQDSDPAKRQRYLDTYINNLQRAAAQFEGIGTQLVMETLNTRDFPDYLLHLPAHVWSVVETAGRKNIVAALDTLATSVMGVDVCEELRLNGSRYAHIQLADSPQRTPPGTGELDFPAIYQAINDSGYRGWIGAEYRPPGATIDSLSWLEQARQALEPSK